jgi:hypothetical protein
LLDIGLKLFDVFGSSFSKRGLSLSVALLPFFGGSIYLERVNIDRPFQQQHINSNVLAFVRLFVFEAALVLAKVQHHRLVQESTR